VEDGKPFCKTCNAPQIRVLTSENFEQQAPESQNLPDQPQQSWPSPASIYADRTAHKASTRAAMIAGIIGGLGSMLLTPLFMLAAGGICITLYHRKVPQTTVPAGQGFRMGLLTGFIGSLVFSGVFLLAMAMPSNRASVQQVMNQRIHDAITTNPDPVAREAMQRISESLTTPGGMATLIGFGLVIFAVLFLILSGIGGAIGAALFGQRPHEH
jgi:hypothetical protein